MKGNKISYRPIKAAEDFKNFGFDTISGFLDEAVSSYVNQHTPGLHEFNKSIDFAWQICQRLEMVRDYDEKSFTPEVNALLQTSYIYYDMLTKLPFAFHPTNMIEDEEEFTDKKYKRSRFACSTDEHLDFLIQEFKKMTKPE